MKLPGRPPRPERTRLYDVMAALVVPAISGMAKLRISGREHLPTTGPFILSPNHFSEVDPLIVAVAVWKSGRVPRFLAKASLWKVPLLGRIFNALGEIPVERAGRSAHGEPLVAARALVEGDLGVVVYPEGSLTRDPDLWPMRGKTGAVRMALEAGVPLIPAAHWGTQKLMPRYGKTLRPIPRKLIDVRFGAPVDLSAFVGKRDQTSMTAATDMLMARIAELLGELRGETPPGERWNPLSSGQSETGRFGA